MPFLKKLGTIDMSRFTTRIELYGEPSFKVYETLHAQMEQAGFSRTILYDGITYWLPNAEYSYEHATDTAHHVKDKAVAIAAKIWDDFGVFVTQTDVTRSIHNLKKVK